MQNKIIGKRKVIVLNIIRVTIPWSKKGEGSDSLLVVDWYKDENTTLKLKNAIEDSLDQDLPISYDKDLLQSKTNLFLSVFIDKAVQGIRVVA